MVSRDDERKALAEIKAIVDKLGSDSYVATAFEGAFEIAEDNINNDFARSVKYYIDKADELEQEHKVVEACKAKLKGTGLNLETACDSVLTLEELREIRSQLHTYRVYYLLQKRSELETTIIRYATQSDSAEFKSAVSQHTEIVERLEANLIAYRHLDEIIGKIS